MAELPLLWEVPRHPVPQPVKPKPRARVIHSAPLTSTTPCIVHRDGPVVVPEERQSLLLWAKQHGYPRQPFLFNRGRAYASVSEGEECWQGFLASASEEWVALVWLAIDEEAA